MEQELSGISRNINTQLVISFVCRHALTAGVYSDRHRSALVFLIQAICRTPRLRVDKTLTAELGQPPQHAPHRLPDAFSTRRRGHRILHFLNWNRWQAEIRRESPAHSCMRTDLGAPLSTFLASV
ncbi:hypothetical protein FS749_003907 [Ceratobasidium sp. UAMH 11750]|nr:hypothetical protein FS749_003907 [Ceratobasidium sp. UAMH 11750]